MKKPLISIVFLRWIQKILQKTKAVGSVCCIPLTPSPPLPLLPLKTKNSGECWKIHSYTIWEDLFPAWERSELREVFCNTYYIAVWFRTPCITFLGAFWLTAFQIPLNSSEQTLKSLTKSLGLNLIKERQWFTQR